MSRPNVLIIKGSGGGGLGDRIRAALVGFVYAELSGRMVFVDWRDGVYAPHGENAFSTLFQLHGLPFICIDDVAPSASTKPSAWAGRLALDMDQVWREDGNTRWDRKDAIARYSFDLSNLSHSERVLVMWDFDQLEALRPHLPAEQAAMEMETLLAHAYQRYLSPSPELAEEVLRCLDGTNGKILGIHVRATRESKQQKGAISLESYFRAADRLLGVNDVGRIIVCTDNSEIEGEILARYPNAWARQKWFSAPGNSLHLNEACPDKLRLAQDALVEMLLLARCDWLISAQNSSFSMLARIMSSAPRSHHIQLSPAVSLVERVRRRLRHSFRL